MEVIKKLKAVYERNNPILCQHVAWIFSSLIKKKEHMIPMDIYTIIIQTLIHFVVNADEENILKIDETLLSLEDKLSVQFKAHFCIPQFINKVLLFFTQVVTNLRGSNFA